VLAENESRPILARTDDSSWFVVTLPDGQHGWVAASVAVVANANDVAAAVPPARTIPPPPPPTAPPATATAVLPGQYAIVTQVIDGDTIEVDLGGSVQRVRYIGIDTPEYNQACGTEATNANRQLVGGQRVRLVKDVSETDPYGRLLRYVYVGATFVNEQLVAQGWAEAVTYPPDTQYAAYFDQLEAQARASNRNCYAQGVFDAPPTATPAPIPTDAPPPPPPSNCHPAYPTVCIPPPPPDLDCRDIPYRRFTVRAPDPHRFDGDNDGIGCESG
jgi:micrococcal nuclease